MCCKHRWSIIAAHLPQRTDNEIKNYWNTNVKKRLIRMGLDPITHKPIKANTFEAYDGTHDQSNDTINMGHVAQWENARLEAEARGSKLQVESHSSHHPSSSDSLSTKHNTVYNMYATNDDLPSPVSTLSIPSWKLPLVSTNIEQFTGISLSSEGHFNVTETSCQTLKIIEDYVANLQDHEITMAVEAFRTARCESIQELLCGSSDIVGLISDSFERDV